MLETYVRPIHGKDKAAELTKLQVGAIHRKLKSKAVTANRVRDVISSMYSWAIKNDLLPRMDNPAATTGKFKEEKRTRTLNSDELQRLGDAIREAETVGILWEPDPTKKTKHAPKAENRRTVIDPSVAAALRLYILTGARLREILGLTWNMIDFERGVLVLPDSKTGAKEIILNSYALLVLSELPRVDKYVIPGRPVRTKGKLESRPRSDMKRPWHAVRKRAGLDVDADNPRFRVRIHDLRHAHASAGVTAGLGLPIVGRLLGHSQARTTEKYAHLQDDPLRRASNVIGETLAKAMGETMKPSAEVIPLRKER
jgi:integrase